MTGSAENDRLTIAAHFRAVGATLGTQGPIGELVQIVASGTMDSAAFSALRKRYAVDGDGDLVRLLEPRPAAPEWFRKQIEDLFLSYLRAVLDGKPATSADLRDIRDLRRFLRINDGELLAHQSSELSRLLGEQIERILADGVVTSSEELLQVELQAALGIGYDDYLELTRHEFEQVYATLRVQASAPGDAGALASQQLKAIEPVYLLATANHKRPPSNLP